jgi:hypothetical protein
MDAIRSCVVTDGLKGRRKLAEWVAPTAPLHHSVSCGQREMLKPGPSAFVFLTDDEVAELMARGQATCPRCWVDR